jgi:hypothetical protein
MIETSIWFSLFPLVCSRKTTIKSALCSGDTNENTNFDQRIRDVVGLITSVDSHRMK